MRRALTTLAMVVLLGCGTVTMTTLSGCGGAGEDTVLENDPELSEQKRAEYEQQMREAMQQQGRPGAPGPGKR